MKITSLMLAVSLAVAGMAYAEGRNTDHHDLAKHLNNGMPKDQVKIIMGDPESVRNLPGWQMEEWVYPTPNCILQFDTGRLSNIRC